MHFVLMEGSGLRASTVQLQLIHQHFAMGLPSRANCRQQSRQHTKPRHRLGSVLCRGSAKANAKPSKPKSSSSSSSGSKKTTSITPPMQVLVKEQLSSLNQTNQPLWSTFCGVTNGVWQGRYAAFYAATGEPEAVFMDSRTPIYDLHTLAVEERPEDHVIMRRLLRSPKLSAVRDASLKSIGGKESEAEAVVRGHSGNGATPEAASISGRGATDSEEWDVDYLTEEEDGLIYFDGGTFSRGPHWLLPPPAAEPQQGEPEEDTALQEGDEVSAGFVELATASPEASEGPSDGEPAFQAAAADYGGDGSRQRTVSTIEQCLAWGGEQRLRLLLTLSVGVEEGEMDVEVLRLALLREAWQGLSEGCHVDRCVERGVGNPVESDSPLSAAERTSPKAFEGHWKAYDISAVPIEDADPLTGEVKRLALHFSQETAQKWSQVPPGRGNEGAAIWLPNRVLVELQMIPPSSRGSAADREEGMQGASGRGFLVTFSWAVKPDTVIGIHREYDAAGELLECRSRSSVRGSWVGGKM